MGGAVLAEEDHDLLGVDAQMPDRCVNTPNPQQVDNPEGQNPRIQPPSPDPPGQHLHSNRPRGCPILPAPFVHGLRMLFEHG